MTENSDASSLVGMTVKVNCACVCTQKQSFTRGQTFKIVKDDADACLVMLQGTPEHRGSARHVTSPNLKARPPQLILVDEKTSTPEPTPDVTNSPLAEGSVPFSADSSDAEDDSDPEDDFAALGG